MLSSLGQAWSVTQCHVQSDQLSSDCRSVGTSCQQLRDNHRHGATSVGRPFPSVDVLRTEPVFQLCQNTVPVNSTGRRVVVASMPYAG